MMVLTDAVSFLKKVSSLSVTLNPDSLIRYKSFRMSANSRSSNTARAH